MSKQVFVLTLFLVFFGTLEH